MKHLRLLGLASNYKETYIVSLISGEIHPVPFGNSNLITISANKGLILHIKLHQAGCTYLAFEEGLDNALKQINRI